LAWTFDTTLVVATGAGRMSVINKMLRDLDSRQPATLPVTRLKQPDTGKDQLTGGTIAVGLGRAAASATPTVRRVLLGGLASLLLALAGWAVWHWLLAAVTEPPVTPLSVAALILPPVQPGLPSSMPSVAASPLPVASATSLPPGKPVWPVSASVLPARLMSAPAPVAQPVLKVPDVPVVAKDALSTEKLTLKLSADAPSAQISAPSAPSATLLPAPTAQRVEHQPRPSAAVWVAQAQALWNEGSRGAAALLLKGALEQVDPSSGADLLDTASVATLAREYARVTLASGQAGETLAALERLEPRLAGVADIWAIRANAAQRLGRHPAAVAAYRQALALRPEEPRWALGTAVSLAAMGQAGPAAEYAEKARIAKALPLDVANYLRQLGVTVKSD